MLDAFEDYVAEEEDLFIWVVMVSTGLWVIMKMNHGV